MLILLILNKIGRKWGVLFFSTMQQGTYINRNINFYIFYGYYKVGVNGTYWHVREQIPLGVSSLSNSYSYLRFTSIAPRK